MQQGQKDSYEKLQSYVEQFKKSGFIAESATEEEQVPKHKKASLAKKKHHRKHKKAVAMDEVDEHVEEEPKKEEAQPEEQPEIEVEAEAPQDEVKEAEDAEEKSE